MEYFSKKYTFEIQNFSQIPSFTIVLFYIFLAFW